MTSSGATVIRAQPGSPSSDPGPHRARRGGRAPPLRSTSSTPPSSTRTKFADDGTGAMPPTTRRRREALAGAGREVAALGDLALAPEARHARGERRAVDVERLLHAVEVPHEVGVGEQVAEPQPGEAEDLRERAQDHDAAAVGDVLLAPHALEPGRRSPCTPRRRSRRSPGRPRRGTPATRPPRAAGPSGCSGRRSTRASRRSRAPRRRSPRGRAAARASRRAATRAPATRHACAYRP